MPSINRQDATPMYLQVYEHIARGIENGVFPVGKKLPSIRECARDLEVSNTTVELAYQKLTAEGYVRARRGSGYTICQVTTPTTTPSPAFDEAYLQDLEKLEQDEAQTQAVEALRYDFSYDSVDASLFPYTTWAHVSREVLFSKGAEAVCLYNDQQGLRAFREEIVRYLGLEHEVSCVPEQVIVMPTTREIVSAVASLFEPARTTIAMEDPGYDEVTRTLATQGYRVKRMPVFPQKEWPQAREHLQGSNLVFATPACQFPTNRTMPLETREELVRWAQETDAYLIDDEYGWEFLQGAARMPSLAALDRSGRVITLGTFSNSFTPALCLSYAVLPPKLALQWRQRHRAAHPLAPWQTQAAMALFMHEGHWRTHIRKARTLMSAKRQALVSALHEHLGDSVEIVAGPSNMFVLVRTLDGRDERELIEAAASAGVRVHPTLRYWSGEAPDDWRYVLVGFSGIPLDDINDGVRSLARAWR